MGQILLEAGDERFSLRFPLSCSPYYTTIRQARAANQSAKSAAQPRKLRLGNAHTRRLFVRKLQAVLLLCFANCCLGLLIPKHTQNQEKRRLTQGSGRSSPIALTQTRRVISSTIITSGHNGFWVIRALSYIGFY